MRTFLLCFFLFFCSASSSHFLGECNRRWVRSCSRFFSHHNWITVLVAFELLELISTNKEKHEWRRITTEAMKLHFIIYLRYEIYWMSNSSQAPYKSSLLQYHVSCILEIVVFYLVMLWYAIHCVMREMKSEYPIFGKSRWYTYIVPFPWWRSCM